jgi:hypothetical protein
MVNIQEIPAGILRTSVNTWVTNCGEVRRLRQQEATKRPKW